MVPITGDSEATSIFLDIRLSSATMIGRRLSAAEGTLSAGRDNRMPALDPNVIFEFLSQTLIGLRGSARCGSSAHRDLFGAGSNPRRYPRPPSQTSACGAE